MNEVKSNLLTSVSMPWPGALLLIASSSAKAADDASISSAGDALRERMQIPWYNAESDSLQPVTLSEPWRPNVDLSWLAQPLNAVLITIAVVLILLLVWMIVRVVRQRERGRAERNRRRGDPLATADRVEALPFLRDRSQHDLLGQARYHYEQGNYSEAIIYLFSYELVELDRSTLVRLAKGKTNRQYLRETGRMRPLAAVLEQTMITFEEVFFGRRPLDREGFEACWNQLDQFETLVSQAQVPA
ncbi:MAG: DUF4129 domain-containing protein [Pirellulales bacterium]